jgi:hypothetical protein
MNLLWKEIRSWRVIWQACQVREYITFTESETVWQIRPSQAEQKNNSHSGSTNALAALLWYEIGWRLPCCLNALPVVHKREILHTMPS